MIIIKGNSMFCYQCQETARGQGCTGRGVCGKTGDVANLQDLLIYVLKGISMYTTEGRKVAFESKEVNEFIMENLFATITNANFDRNDFIRRITKALEVREDLKNAVANAGGNIDSISHDAANFTIRKEEYDSKAEKVGILATENEDVRS